MMDLLLPSLDHAIRVAHQFDYQWPVFYRLPSLAVVKAETKPGEGGEYDVSGLYLHVMLQAYELTREPRYREEAEAAARHIEGKGFRLLYQTNNTLMTATALLKLWRLTDKRLYRDLSMVCMANVAARMWIWNARYGHGSAFDTFMGIAPLQDAPYLAAYEEHEFLGSAVSYLKEAGQDLHPALAVLIPEYMKYLLHRARFYFCAELPADAVCQDPKEGRIRPELFVPLEDIRTGWKQAGAVGQEVYGAAAAFILTTAAYVNRRELPFLIRSEYPVVDFDFRRTPGGGAASLQLAGDPRFRCRLTIVPRQAETTVAVTDARGRKVRGRKSGGGTAYVVEGGARCELTWTKRPSAKARRHP